MKLTVDKFAAIKIDLRDSENNLEVFRIWSGRKSLRGLGEKVDNSWEEFNLGLNIPFSISISINAEQYGGSLRGSLGGNNIEFFVNDKIRNYVNNYSWQSGEIKIYEGKEDQEFIDMELVFVGKVSNLSYDFISEIASVSVIDLQIDLNKPLVTELYQKVPGVLDIEGLNGVLSKEITTDTILTPGECTSQGIVFTGSIGFIRTITFVEGFSGLIQISNQTDKDLIFQINSPGGSSVTIESGLGEVLFSDGNSFMISSGAPEETTRENLIGLPKPKLWGEVNSIEPILETDDLIKTYRISTLRLDEILAFSVGGIEDWEKVSSAPESGEWKENLSLGTIELSSVVLGSDIRCNVRADGYESLTTGELVKEILEEKGKEINEDSLTEFNLDSPQLIGYYKSTTAINTLDALDEITSSMISWWTFGFVGELLIGVVKKPNDEETLSLSEREIQSFKLNSIIHPVWRIRVQFKRNFSPLSNPLNGLTQGERLLLMSEGLNNEAYNNAGILEFDPLAIDISLIKSLVLNESDANLIRDRVSEAWGVERRVYDLNYSGDDLPEFYSTIKISFQGIEKNFRVHSISRSIGGGEHELKIWG